MKNKTLKSFLMIVSCISSIGTATWNVNAIENDSIELNPTTIQSTEDTSLPFKATIDEKFLGGCIITLVKSNYNDIAKNWTADYINNELGITDIESIELSFTDKNTGRHCLFFNLTNDTKETALAVAQKLYDTGWFYSVEMNYNDETLAEEPAEDTSLPFKATIDEKFLGGCIITLVKSNYSDIAKNWNADYINNELGIIDIESIKFIFTDQSTGRRCIFFNLTDDTKETALAVAQKLYDTGWFYSVEMNYEDTILSEEVKGDATGDGKVDILDVITINRAILGKEKISDEQLKAIDFNNNNKPDSEEALTLMKYIVGLISEL